MQPLPLLLAYILLLLTIPHSHIKIPLLDVGLSFLLYYIALRLFLESLTYLPALIERLRAIAAGNHTFNEGGASILLAPLIVTLAAGTTDLTTLTGKAIYVAEGLFLLVSTIGVFLEVVGHDEEESHVGGILAMSAIFWTIVFEVVRRFLELLP